MSLSKGSVRIGRGAILSVHLEVCGAWVEDPEDSLLWDGKISCANFVVTLPTNPENTPFPPRPSSI